MERILYEKPLPAVCTELGKHIDESKSSSKAGLQSAEYLHNYIRRLKWQDVLDFDVKDLGPNSRRKMTKKLAEQVRAAKQAFHVWFRELREIHPEMVDLDLASGDEVSSASWNVRAAGAGATFAVVLVPGECALDALTRAGNTATCDLAAVWPKEYPEFCCQEHAALHALQFVGKKPDPDEAQIEEATERGRLEAVAELESLASDIDGWEPYTKKFGGGETPTNPTTAEDRISHLYDFLEDFKYEKSVRREETEPMIELARELEGSHLKSVPYATTLDEAVEVFRRVAELKR